MKRSRNLDRRSQPFSRDSTQESKGDRSKDGKRKRQTLGDRTNFSVQDILQHSKKRKQLRLGEDKENIPPEDGNLLSGTVQKHIALPTKFEQVFSLDILRCKKDGHLFVLEYVLAIARALV